MSTYREVRNAVISDLARENEEGITAAADNALSIAIRHYEGHPWWFLETQTALNATNGTEYYDLPSDMGSTEFTLRIADTVRYPLVKRTFGQIDEWSSGITTYGSPTDYAIYQNQIRLYPIPDASYSGTLSYVAKLGAPAEGSSNAWTTDGEMLIRTRAEWQLHSLRYHDAEAATVAKQTEMDSYRSLQRQQMQRTSTGQTRKRRV